MRRTGPGLTVNSELQRGQWIFFYFYQLLSFNWSEQIRKQEIKCNKIILVWVKMRKQDVKFVRCLFLAVELNNKEFEVCRITPEDV